MEYQDITTPLTSGYLAENLESGLVSTMHVHKPADQSIQQNHENGSERIQEEIQLFAAWILLGHQVTRGADQVEHEEGGKPYCCI